MTPDWWFWDWWFWLRWLGAQMTVAAVAYPILKLWRIL